MNKTRIDNIRKQIHSITEPLYNKRTGFGLYTTPQENDILEYIDTELSCLMYIDGKDYYKTWTKKRSKNISELYVDQAPYVSRYGDRKFSSVYLESGLKNFQFQFSVFISK
jgi:hypothetical protein